MAREDTRQAHAGVDRLAGRTLRLFAGLHCSIDGPPLRRKFAENE